MRNEKGQFAPGNSFAKGHGAPARNTNAVKTGVYMRFEEGETPYDRLRGGESEIKRWCIDAAHLLMLARREYRQERQRLKETLDYGK